MKTTMFLLCLILLLLVSATSCQTSEPVIRSPEYTSGRQLADQYAKKDVMKNACSHSRGKVLSAIIKKHLEAMENNKSEDFKAGFRDGYRVYYHQYVDLYCLR
jgi:predicted secreted protein